MSVFHIGAGTATAARAAPGRACLGTGPILAEARALAGLGLPIMMISLVNMGMSVTDTVMVSRMFGAGALAAIAIGSDLYSIVFYLGIGVLAGVAPFHAAAVARADGGECRRLIRAGCAAAALVAAVGVPLIWQAPAWLGGLGIAPALLEAGSGYTRAMAVTFVPMLGVALCRTLLTAAERPKVFLRVTIAMLPLNAAADYVLMAGLGPVPGFGPTGAGLASLLVATLSLAVLALVVGRATPRVGAAGAAGRSGRGDGTLGRILRVGLPIGIATVGEVGIFLAATVYAGRLGASDVAAHALVLRAAGVAYAVPTGLLQAAMVRMARAASGVAGPDAGRRVIVAALALSLLAGAGLLALLVAGAGPLAGLVFDAGPEGREAAATAAGLLVLLGLLEWATTAGSVAAGLLRGVRDTRMPMVFAMAGHWAVGAPLGLHLCEAEGMGVTGLWLGLAAGSLVTAALNLVRLFSGRVPGIPLAAKPA